MTNPDGTPQPGPQARPVASPQADAPRNAVPPQEAPAAKQNTPKQKDFLNEESGIGFSGVAHAAIAVGSLTAAFTMAAGSPFLAIGLGVLGAAFAVNTLGSTWFFQDQNYSTVTEFFGQKKGNISGGGIKLKQPWPWRSVKKTLPTFTQMEEDIIRDIQTKDGAFIHDLEYDVFYEIVDAGTNAYAAANAIDQMKSRVAGVLRACVGSSYAILRDEDNQAEIAANAEIYDLNSDKDEIQAYVINSLNDEMIQKYGVKLVQIAIKEPKLDDRFIEATAEKMVAIQAGLARKVSLKLEGEGLAAQRDEVIIGSAKAARAMVTEGVFDTMDEAIAFVTEMNGRETIREASRSGAVIITDGQSAAGNFGLSQLMTSQAALMAHEQNVAKGGARPAARKTPDQDAGASPAPTPE